MTCASGRHGGRSHWARAGGLRRHGGASASTVSSSGRGAGELLLQNSLFPARLARLARFALPARLGCLARHFVAAAAAVQWGQRDAVRLRGGLLPAGASTWLHEMAFTAAWNDRRSLLSSATKEMARGSIRRGRSSLLCHLFMSWVPRPACTEAGFVSKTVPFFSETPPFLAVLQELLAPTRFIFSVENAVCKDSYRRQILVIGFSGHSRHCHP